MSLQCVSLTGADDTVDPAALMGISKRFPLVEWAILSCEKAKGSMRFPTDDWVARFHKACPHVRKAIHLCGKDVDAFLAKDPQVHAKVAKFDRVQLNFNQRRTPKDLKILVQVAERVAPTILVQHNSANAMLWSELRSKITNLSILFDSSGGGGISPKSGWPEMFPRTVCGFAGGLGPDNIAAEFEKIMQIAKGQNFWIDMEGKLRSSRDDSFDLQACVAVLEHTLLARIRT